MIDLDKLKNGYVSTGNKKLARMFFIECLRHDELNMPIISSETFIEWAAIAVNERGTPCGHGSSAINGKIELTEGDFIQSNPPRTKVEYVKCELSYSEIAKEMIDGKIFYDESGKNSYAWSGYRFERNNGLSIEIRGDFYRRTEVEIDWKEDAKLFFDSYKQSDICDYINFHNENGNTVMQNDFIKMCHLVAELTEKPQ